MLAAAGMLSGDVMIECPPLVYDRILGGPSVVEFVVNIAKVFMGWPVSIEEPRLRDQVWYAQQDCAIAAADAGMLLNFEACIKSQVYLERPAPPHTPKPKPIDDE